MKRIHIEEVGYTPGIILDSKKQIFKMTGKACPEDAIGFYEPIIDWLELYSVSPNEETVFEFKLSYYNTASSKALLKIMQFMERLKEKGVSVKIKWYYYEDDEELLIAGEDYSEIIEVPFELIEIKN